MRDLLKMLLYHRAPCAPLTGDKGPAGRAFRAFFRGALVTAATPLLERGCLLPYGRLAAPATILGSKRSKVWHLKNSIAVEPLLWAV
jgi:hypothetical protein